MVSPDSKAKPGEQESLSPLWPRRIAVTGGRDFADETVITTALQGHVVPGDTLVHGGARGADTLAHRWAKAHGIDVEVHPANWTKHQKAAGPIRNQEMVDSGLDLLIAFPGGSGTAHMVRVTRAAGIEVVFADDDDHFDANTPQPGHLF